MPSDDPTPDTPERRGLERRIEVVDQKLRQMETQVAVMEATLKGLVSTMDSRHTAFERGQDLILKGIDQLEKTQLKQEADLKALATAPQDLSRIVFSPGVVMTIIGTILAIIGGQQASTWGIKSDIRDISTRQTLQADMDKTTQKLQEERTTAFSRILDGVAKKQELQQLEIQNLRETILNQRRSP